MSDYTFVCDDCGKQITVSYPKEAPFIETHTVPIEGTENCVEELCEGKFYRQWKSTQFEMKGKGYESDSPYG